MPVKGIEEAPGPEPLPYLAGIGWLAWEAAKAESERRAMYETPVGGFQNVR